MAKSSHCSYCGQRFPPGALWPRVCAGCGEISYLNPVPVTVVLVPIEPGRGHLALPGGFVNAGESWQAAGAREVAEETGLRVSPDELNVFAVHSAPAPADCVLIFALAGPRTSADLAGFAPNEETSELAVLSAPQPLAFPLHTRVAGEYFARRAKGGH